MEVEVAEENNKSLHIFCHIQERSEVIQDENIVTPNKKLFINMDLIDENSI